MNRLRTQIKLSELDSTTTNVVRIFGDFPELNGDEFLSVEISKLAELSNKLNTAIKQDRISNKLDALDTDRDDAIRSFSRMIESYGILPVARTKENASVLIKIFAKYKKTILKESYASQSSSINSLLTDLKEPKALEAIGRLKGVSDIIEVIKNTQSAFTIAYDEYMANVSNKNASATSYKSPILELINLKIRRYLDTMVMINEAKYGEFAKRFELEIEKANASVKAKKETKTTE